MRIRHLAAASLLGLMLVATGARAEGGNPSITPLSASRNLRVSRVTLSATQIQALTTKPVTLVRAPGNGRLIVVQLIVLRSIPGSIYFIGSSVTANIQYSTNPDLTGDIASSSEFQGFLQTAPESRVLNPIGYDGKGVGPEFTAQVLNEPVTLTTSSDLTNGNGTLRVTTFYQILTP
jgi:hypothetical protein